MSQPDHHPTQQRQKDGTLPRSRPGVRISNHPVRAGQGVPKPSKGENKYSTYPPDVEHVHPLLSLPPHTRTAADMSTSVANPTNGPRTIHQQQTQPAHTHTPQSQVNHPRVDVPRGRTPDAQPKAPARATRPQAHTHTPPRPRSRLGGVSATTAETTTRPRAPLVRARSRCRDPVVATAAEGACRRRCKVNK